VPSSSGRNLLVSWPKAKAIFTLPGRPNHNLAMTWRFLVFYPIASQHRGDAEGGKGERDWHGGNRAGGLSLSCTDISHWLQDTPQLCFLFSSLLLSEIPSARVMMLLAPTQGLWKNAEKVPSKLLVLHGFVSGWLDENPAGNDVKSMSPSWTWTRRSLDWTSHSQLVHGQSILLTSHAPRLKNLLTQSHFSCRSFPFTDPSVRASLSDWQR
jgi:hypothetical protein